MGIEHLRNSTSDLILYYFENHRRSGGGPIDRIQNRGDSFTLIYFENVEGNYYKFSLFNNVKSLKSLLMISLKHHNSIDVNQNVDTNNLTCIFYTLKSYSMYLSKCYFLSPISKYCSQQKNTKYTVRSAFSGLSLGVWYPPF